MEAYSVLMLKLTLTHRVPTRRITFEKLTSSREYCVRKRTALCSGPGNKQIRVTQIITRCHLWKLLMSVVSMAPPPCEVLHVLKSQGYHSTHPQPNLALSSTPSIPNHLPHFLLWNSSTHSRGSPEI
jgi:hypothetical protein